MIDIIHKAVKPSHLEKIQIIQNINKQVQCSNGPPELRLTSQTSQK